MEILLMVGCMSLLGMAVAGLAFGAATRTVDAQPVEKTEQEPVVMAMPTRFFVNNAAVPTQSTTPVPIEALLLQIERHVRLEHAAAESFLEMPTPSLLHSRTMSPFVN